ncbi:hypothetical protein DPMN_118424 [Dreissena polymorpha]|uniref:Uncharacterized protein n=1 Tax=Dreissena polymorpha TaxID=45954 RepID=A0A9D4GK59_DREPO|nr:hypothetical protein DPMN_118424 [Dreissena polymorpha]
MVCPVGQVLGSNSICFYPSREWTATFFEIPVKLSLENPIILPQNTSLEEIRLYTSNIKFSFNALEHNSSIQIKDAYVNVVNKIDSVELDYIALFVVVHIVQLDPAKAVPQLLQFFEAKWTAVYGGSTVTLKQTIMDIDVTSAELVTMMAKEEGRTLPKCSSNLALIYKSLVYESLTKAVPISKTYFCRLIEFVEDEVELFIMTLWYI